MCVHCSHEATVGRSFGTVAAIAAIAALATSMLVWGCAGGVPHDKRGSCVIECESDNERCVVLAPDADNAAKCEEGRAECVQACP